MQNGWIFFLSILLRRIFNILNSQNDVIFTLLNYNLNMLYNNMYNFAYKYCAFIEKHTQIKTRADIYEKRH